jgi:PAS domain S-box-containing protein
MRSEPRLIATYTRHWPVLALMVVALYSLWISFRPEALSGGLFTIVLVFGVRLATALAAERGLRRITDAAAVRVWRNLVVGLLIWALADAATLIQALIQGRPPITPALRDLLMVAGYFGVLTAIIRYRPSQEESFGRLREILDVSILILSVVALAWLVFLGPAVDVSGLKVSTIVWLAIRPVLDLTLLLLVLRLLIVQAGRSERETLAVLLIGSILFFISDLAASLLGTFRYQTSPSLVEAGWMLGTLALGSIFRWQSGQANMTTEHALEPVRSWRTRLELLFPMVFTYAVVGFLFFDWWFSGELDWVGVGAAALLIGLLFARQGVIAGQHELRQFAALINAAADMAFICDLEGQVRLANPSLLRALGIPGKESEGWGLPSVLVSPDPGGIPDILIHAHQQGWSGEVVFQNQAGDRFPASLEMRPVQDPLHGGYLIAGTAHDLTDILKREEDLRTALGDINQARRELAELNLDLEQKVETRTSELEATVADLARLNEELQELDQLKSEFVALVSHELRAPLTNIRSGVELLLEREGKLTRSTLESLALIQSETERLTMFVETILDLSALEAGRVELALKSLEVEGVIQETLGRFPARLVQTRIRIDLAPDLPPVLADRRALSSVLFHMLDNASKYAPEGLIHVSGQVENKRVQIEVRDEGPGIPPVERERVFEMFHRLDASDAREVYGHGLGLPMARRLMEAMAGEIGVIDSPTGGASVIISLPLAFETEARPG